MRKGKLICGLNYALIGSMILGNIAPVFASEYPHIDKVQYDADGNSVAEVHETVDIEDAGTSSTNVYAELGSEFVVTVPKSLTLDGVTKLGTYTVSVEGDIAGYEKVNVIPDESFTLESTGLNDVTAGIEQDKTSWLYSEFDIAGNGMIDASGITAGIWNGTFNFNINLESSSKIKVASKDSEGNDLNATANEITGTKKETLLNSLESTGMIGSADEVDALIEVESDDFEGMADTTFNVSSIASEGDKVAILHFDETKQEWEYMGTDIVDADGNISADFSSYSPVAFVKIENGNYEKAESTAGLYDSDNRLICTWKESGIDIERNYTESKYKTEITSPYYVLNKPEYASVTKIVIPESTKQIGAYAFYNCAKLKDIIIPDNITNISLYAFNGTAWLTAKYAENTLIIVNENLIIANNASGNIVIPEGVIRIHKFAFNGCTNLTSVVIPTSVTSISSYAFYGCTNLKNITFKDTTTWYKWDFKGQNKTLVDSSVIRNSSIMADYLTKDLYTWSWTKE